MKFNDFCAKFYEKIEKSFPRCARRNVGAVWYCKASCDTNDALHRHGWRIASANERRSRGRRMRRGFQTRVQGDSSALFGQSVRGAERRNLPSLKIHLDRFSTSKLINSKFESTFDVEIN